MIKRIKKIFKFCGVPILAKWISPRELESRIVPTPIIAPLTASAVAANCNTSKIKENVCACLSSNQTANPLLICSLCFTLSAVCFTLSAVSVIWECVPYLLSYTPARHWQPAYSLISPICAALSTGSDCVFTKKRLLGNKGLLLWFLKSSDVVRHTHKLSK